MKDLSASVYRSKIRFILLKLSLFFHASELLHFPPLSFPILSFLMPNKLGI